MNVQELKQMRERLGLDRALSSMGWSELDAHRKELRKAANTILADGDVTPEAQATIQLVCDRADEAKEAHEGMRKPVHLQIRRGNEADDPATPKPPDLGGYSGFHEFLVDVRAAAQGRISERIRPLMEPKAAAGSDEQSAGDSVYGGVSVPTGLGPQFLTREVSPDPLARYVRKVPMPMPTMKYIARTDKDHTTSVSGGLRVYRKPEKAPGTASRMEMQAVTLEATNLFGLAYASEEILEDSALSFAMVLAEGFRDEFIGQLMQERLNGTGVGQFLGVNNSPCLITQDKETGQAADTIVSANVIKMRSRCYRYQDAVWIANQTTLPQLMEMTLGGGLSAVPAWSPSVADDAPDRLLGRPIFYDEHCAVLGDVGDIMLGNWSQYLEGDYTPLRSESSIWVRFVEYERAFRFYTRNDAAPWWKAALTPRNGATLSPFVRLQAR